MTICMHVAVMYMYKESPFPHLCRNGAVRFESVMWLRNKLDKLGKMEGVNTAENG